MDFCHLHVHNEYSLLDGLGTAESYAKRAKELGYKYLALTNHGNVDGLIKFQNACKAEGIVPICGCELYVVKDISVKIKGDDRRHIVVLVENETGWHNLLRMLTVANLDGYYSRPRVDPKLIMENCKGLVFMSACTASLLRVDWGMKLFLALHKKLPGKVFLETMAITYAKQNEMNKFLLELHGIYKGEMPLVATNDCHYVLAHSAKTHEVLLAMQSKAKWRDPNRWRFETTDLFLKSEREMAISLRRQHVLNAKQCDGAMANTLMVAEICKNFNIPKKEVVLPQVPGFEDKDDAKELRGLCANYFRSKVARHVDKRKKATKYKERMEEELDSIIRLGFARYFLIVWELIDWCHKNDIMCGPGRGSVGGSLVSYLLGITMVDPMQHDLSFARFISPERIDLPDIDMDFEDRKRWMIRKHLEDIYGREHVAGVSTFATMHGKGAIRDVSRVFEIPYVDVDKMAKSIVARGEGDMREDLSIADACETFEDGIAFKKKYPEIVDISIELEGQVKGMGQHAAAIIVSSHDLRDCDRAHLRAGKDENKPIINWYKDDAEHVGLMKLDVLGLNTLTVLSEIAREVKKNHGKDIIFEDIPLDDKRILDEFTKGNSIGCFQFGSGGLRRYLSQLGIDSFSELIAANALWRPGTLRTGVVSDYVLRKTGASEIEHVHPIVDEITKETYGILLYQEQIMYFMYYLAGLGWKTADTIRKVVSKKKGVEQFNEYKVQFIEGCLCKDMEKDANGKYRRAPIGKKAAEEIWEKASAFGHYGFNKCMSRLTKIYRCAKNQYADRELSVEEAYLYQKSYNFRRRKLKILAKDGFGRVKAGTIREIIYTGKNHVFCLSTRSGKSIKVTADHRLLINDDWACVKDANRGDHIRVTDFLLPDKTYMTTGTGSGAHNHDGSDYQLQLKLQRTKLKKRYHSKCQKCGSNRFCEMHHKDGDHRNNTDENTQYLCRKCHPKHGGGLLRKGYLTYNDKITSIKYAGIEDTYDIEMAQEPHNFIANGIVSHNSHACAYAMLAVWCMYFKVYHPAEFISCSLTYSNDNKKEDLVEEGKRLGLDLMLPKVGTSKAKEWAVVGKKLYVPFVEIKGFGAKTVDKISSKGFFKQLNTGKIGTKADAILSKIWATNDHDPNDVERESVQNLFVNFNIMRDRYHKYKKVVARISEYRKLISIGDVDFVVPESRDQLFFGTLNGMKFGYREKILKAKGHVQSLGFADSLGGVYGMFSDYQGSDCMFIFNQELYARRKFEVEHSDGAVMLAKCSHPHKQSNLLCNNMYLADEIMSANLQGLDLRAINIVDRTRHKEAMSCNECSLREECRSPVCPSSGRYNVAICGEAPGRDEDIEGMGFVGKSGNLLWKELDKYALPRNFFHVTNAVKCFPKETKTPGKKHISACKRWLDGEMDSVRPIIMLAFGNTCLKVFKGEESGIMSLSGATEWNDYANCWICWCVHPASVLYSPENRELFEKGIENFANKFRMLS